MSAQEGIRRDFVANVSHELRTPVAVIRANAETLLQGALEEPEESRRFVEAIEKNAQRLTELISDLLDLSRIEAGNYGLTLRGLRVSKAVARAMDSVGQLAPQHGVEISMEVDPEETVLADKGGLDQVLINLIDNAIKHSPKGGKVTVRTVPDARGVRIEVEDDGPGVEVHLRDRIFERFFRADPGRSRDKGGTGLGLAIVKHLIDLMNGLLGVKSGDGGGAVFWFVLPAEEAEPSEAELLRDTAQPGKRSSSDLSLEEQALESDLRRLRKRLVRMASRVDRMIGDAVKALIKSDKSLAKRTIKADAKINRDEIRTDELCLQVLARHTPQSTDLRFITVALKMVSDLERIGDLAVSICRRAASLAKAPPLSCAGDMQRMADAARKMVRDSIDAFVDGDVKVALEIVQRDDEVDRMYRKLFGKVIKMMSDDDSLLEYGAHLLSVAKALERIADHTTNIAEQVVFLVEGRDIRHFGSRDDI